MKNKFINTFLFLVLTANVFAVSPTSKNVNKAKRYYATLERIMENFDSDTFSQTPYTEAFFSIGRMVHFLEVLQPVFEDFYDNGVAEFSLGDVNDINDAYESFNLEVKPVLEMMFYNFDEFLIRQLMEDEDFSDMLENFSAAEIKNLSLGDFSEMGYFSKDDIYKIKRDLPKYKNFSDAELANLSFLEFLYSFLEIGEMKEEIGFDLTEIKKWRSEYERGLAYDKIEFD